MTVPFETDTNAVASTAALGQKLISGTESTARRICEFAGCQVSTYPAGASFQMGRPA